MAVKKAESYTTPKDIIFVTEERSSARVFLQEGWDGGVGIYVEGPNGDEWQLAEVVDGVLRLRDGIFSDYLSTDSNGYVKVERA